MLKDFFLLLLITPMVYGFPKFYGEWVLRHSTVPDLPDNRVVVHIFPDNQLMMKYRFTRGPIVFHKSKIGTYRIFTQHDHVDKQLVDVSFHSSEEVFLSVYGIGLQNFNIKTNKKQTHTLYRFIMTFVEMDDIYLQSIAHSEDCFHIVRSLRINEPSVDIPLSTFLTTQIIGTVLGHMINEFLFHSSG